MAETVADILDSDVFHAAGGDSIGQLLHDITLRGAALAPPPDPARIGSRDEPGASCAEQAAVSVHQKTSISVAARILAEHNADCLVLVNDAGVAVGVLSALDLLQALFGVAKSNPAPVAAQKRSAAWSRAATLDADTIRKIPPAPGIILLDRVLGDARRPSVVWVEGCANVRERLEGMLHPPQSDPALQALLDVVPRRLEFRVLIVVEAERRARLLRALREVLSHAQPSVELAAG
jgi:CBS domain-containing protein